MLASDRIRRIQAGLTGLAARKQVSEAGPWLMERIRANDPRIDAYFRWCLRAREVEIQEWERAMLVHLMKVRPLATLVTVSCNPPPYLRKETLPSESMETLRAFLHEQLTDERQRWWREAAERDRQGRLEPERERDCQGLSQGIAILDRLDDPADVPLLLKLLEHPAAQADFYSSGNGTLFYNARIAAEAGLKRRKIKLPGPVVTQVSVKLPAPPPEPSGGSMEFPGPYERPITGVTKAVLAAACLALWIIRLRRRRERAGEAATGG
jgi:hypothetical protein